MNNDAQDILDELQSAINDMHTDRMRMLTELQEARARITELEAMVKASRASTQDWVAATAQAEIEIHDLLARLRDVEADRKRIAVIAGLEPSDPSPQPYVALEAVRQAPATAGEEKL